MTELETRDDGVESVLTGIGDALRDKTKSFTATSARLSRREIETMYEGDGIASRIVDSVGEEALRVPVTVAAASSDPGHAHQSAEWLEDCGALEMVRMAVTLARRDGGAAIYLNTGHDSATPCDASAAPLFLEFELFSHFDLQVVERYNDPTRSNRGKPVSYLARSVAPGLPLLERRIHESRMIRFEGVKRLATSSKGFAISTGRLSNGVTDSPDWGQTVLMRAYDAVQAYAIAWASISHLLVDGSQSVIKMKNLEQKLLAKGGQESFNRRMAAIEMSRSVARAVAMDADGEDFDRQPYAFGGVADIVDRLQMHVSAMARIPVSVLFGRSPAGLNATGESDTRHFYDQVRITQKRQCKPALERILGIGYMLDDGPTQGVVPPSYAVSFGPLQEPSAAERTALRKQQSEIDVAYVNAGVLTSEEVAISRFAPTGYSDETTVDIDTRLAQQELDAEAAAQSATASRAGADDVQSTALNGAQVSAMVEIASQYQAGTLTREAAIAIIVSSFPVSPDVAAQIIPPTPPKPRSESANAAA